MRWRRALAIIATIINTEPTDTMPYFLRIAQTIDRFTELTARGLAWLTLATMLLLAAVVFTRYGLQYGSVALQESVTYLHATVFMLGIACALKRDEHVRVDIFYRHFSPRAKAWVNSLGAIIFLLPLCVYIGTSSIDFVSQSWHIHESSSEPGGIPAVYLLKSLIPLMAINLALQALAEILRNAAVLVGDHHA